MLTRNGKTREEAYEIVQKEGLRAFDAGDEGDFRKNMRAHLSEEELNECFDEKK